MIIRNTDGQASGILSFYQERIQNFFSRQPHRRCTLEMLCIEADGFSVSLGKQQEFLTRTGVRPLIVPDDLEDMLDRLPGFSQCRIYWRYAIREEILPDEQRDYSSGNWGPSALVNRMQPSDAALISYQGLSLTSDNWEYELFAIDPANPEQYGRLPLLPGWTLVEDMSDWKTDVSSLNFQVTPAHHENAGELMRICGELLYLSSWNETDFSRQGWNFSLDYVVFRNAEDIRFFVRNLQRVADLLKPELKEGHGLLTADSTFACMDARGLAVLHIYLDEKGKVKVRSARTGMNRAALLVIPQNVTANKAAGV